MLRSQNSYQIGADSIDRVSLGMHQKINLKNQLKINLKKISISKKIQWLLLKKIEADSALLNSWYTLLIGLIGEIR